MSEGFFKERPPLFDHQSETIDFAANVLTVFDTSDPGTGKTRSWIEVILADIESDPSRKFVVFAPKSILEPAWGADLIKFAPQLSYSIANANNRKKAFEQDVNIYITNHDAIKWVNNNWGTVSKDRNLYGIIIDESTAFKHRTSQRSRAAATVTSKFARRALLSGTPNSNGLQDLWHQVYLLDGGEHLGANFWAYRNMVCSATQVGPSAQHQKWDDKDGADQAVAELIKDITVRHVFEECIDIPEHNEYTVTFDLSTKHQAAYDMLKNHAIVMAQSGEIAAFNAGVVAQKLLQMASGAVYTGEGAHEVFSTQRYELVTDLIEARESCVVAFNWRHQRDALIELAKSRKFKYGLIDGSVTSQARRTQVVEDFQNGFIDVLYAHPASAGHGLTLTRGTSTIWTSPTYNAEQFVQFNKRIYRAGQTRKTETVMVAANNTIDVEVYAKLTTKLSRLSDLLGMLVGEENTEEFKDLNPEMSAQVEDALRVALATFSGGSIGGSET
jgi:SNF2 family DNA or RNA helicase